MLILNCSVLQSKRLEQTVCIVNCEHYHELQVVMAIKCCAHHKNHYKLSFTPIWWEKWKMTQRKSEMAKECGRFSLPTEWEIDWMIECAIHYWRHWKTGNRRAVKPFVSLTIIWKPSIINWIESLSQFLTFSLFVSLLQFISITLRVECYIWLATSLHEVANAWQSR